MKRPHFQFGLNAVFAATTGAAILMAAGAGMALREGTANPLATLLAAWLLCAVVTLIFGFVISTFVYLAFLALVILIEPAAGRPSWSQFRIAAAMLTVTAALAMALLAIGWIIND